MKYWQLENEALQELGFVGVDGKPDRERAVQVVIELLRRVKALEAKAKESK